MPDGSVSAAPARSIAVGWSSFLTLLADEPGVYAPETLARVRAELGDHARVVAYVRAADAIEGDDGALVVIGSDVERAALEDYVGPIATTTTARRGPSIPAALVLRLFAIARREARPAA
jgi:hypothetical protein